MKAYTFNLLASLAALQFTVTSALSIKSFARSSSSSSNSSSSSSQESYQQNVTSLLYPNCTVNAAADWCGLVLGIVAFENDTTTYNISITDSSCQRVGRADGILQNSTTNISTSVGDWTFKIYDGSGLDMVYNGVDIGNSSIFGGDFGLEEFNMSGEAVTTVVYGDYKNCTPASKAKSESAPVRQLPGTLASLGLATVSLLFWGLL